MRNPKATLEDLADATSRYANLASPEAMLVMRLVTDVMEFMAMLRVGEAELTRLEVALEAKDEEIQGLETVLVAGQMIVCQQNATIGNLHEDLAEKDAEKAIVRDGLLVLLRKSQGDVVALATDIEEKDAEIERLRDEIAQGDDLMNMMNG